ncbi:efflux RND transporter periplasmic adaptor subunit [Thiocystis violacea]|uniref:efflux RND transporter periplasmic adaptor subunit n=1 Tax=Thiocystis violacea TaxID=13725 RepID=UPI00190769EA|nr:efflux RND transporter periplasmic adaptor subunit [Thiocystis violacea]MBK1718543.1 efflux transporter periplasmic adaptor subunit [Thiocystis violacea]
MRFNFARTGLLLTGSVLLASCRPSADKLPEAPLPWVLTAPVEVSDAGAWSLTGTLRARHEIPLAFRVGGEVSERLVDAGDRVKAGAVLFRLDPKDLIQARVAAEAGVASARAERENAEREHARLIDMLARKLASQQDHDRAETSARAARERLTAAEADLERAINGVDYAALRAPVSGVILEVSGQVGQVVSAGRTLGVLAQSGPLELEVDVPEARRDQLPEQGLVDPIGGDEPVKARRREIAGAADPLTRTWRARYQLDEAAADWPLGSTATLRLGSGEGASGGRRRVPLGAVLERGQGAQVWRLVDGRAQPEPVRLLAIVGEYAEIETDLAPGTQVIALGVSRLSPGQAARARQP